MASARRSSLREPRGLPEIRLHKLAVAGRYRFYSFGDAMLDPVIVREADADLRAFRLTATEATLRARIVGRPESDGPHDWCLRHMPLALAAMGRDLFGAELPTDGRTPEEIGAAILGTL